MDTHATAIAVFPAHAGMSPGGIEIAQLLAGFPRSRGDEPLRRLWLRLYAPFSPLTRG